MGTSRCSHTCFCIACHCFSRNNLLKLVAAMLYLNYLPRGDCAFSASFVKECTE